MAALVFCNACFRKPQGASPKFSLTNCGHVICEQCLQKGKKDECLICRAPCRTIVLSKKMNSDIQSLFMGIDGLCRKYSKEITQIAQFQEKHRRRLLAHYRGKISKLEGYVKKATQQIQHIQQQQQQQQQQQHRVSSMEVDHLQSSARKTETVTGPMRISLISPPQNGHMGSVKCRSSQSSGITSCQKSTPGSIRSSPLRMPNSVTSYMSPFVSSQNSRNHIPDTFGLRNNPHYPTPSLRNTPHYPASSCTPTSSLSSVTRHPISLSSLLQRQHLGSARLPGYSLQK
ncbi:probable E3 SUMO-protein ligase RNF212 [Elgaria multicarinata webbii]|uniref:probable E3 SUMO-protein ligase RNF212 n=1 Tax=Elgaria multicarinata webbii TaxID=159646 RepID=UPI002FCCCE29